MREPERATSKRAAGRDFFRGEVTIPSVTKINPNRYHVIYERTRTGWAAYPPNLQGCVAAGRSREIVELRIREAIRVHMAGMFQDGTTVPGPYPRRKPG